jgi:hypothetical protein
MLAIWGVILNQILFMLLPFWKIYWGVTWQDKLKAKEKILAYELRERLKHYENDTIKQELAKYFKNKKGK